MLIGTLLPPPQLVRLTDTAHDLFAGLIPAQDWQHLHEVMRRRPVSVVVVDPLAGRGLAATEVVRLIKNWPSTPVIAYTQLTSDSARVLAILGRQGLRDVIFLQYDDGRIRMGRKLRRAAASRLVAKVRQGLTVQLNALPGHVAATIDDLLERPYAFQAGVDLATASGEPRRTLQRALQRAGLASPRRLLMAARLAHVAAYLQDPGLRVQDVAEKLGYARTDVLVRHALEVWGVRPGSLRRRGDSYSEEWIVGRLIDWVRQGAPATSPLASATASDTKSSSLQ